MPLHGLTIIGESINDSVPSTNKLFAANDIAGIKQLARSQDIGGAGYIDVNVGKRSPAFLAEMVREVQGVTAKPLSIDTPDPEMAEAALKAYDLARASGQVGELAFGSDKEPFGGYGGGAVFAPAGPLPLHLARRRIEADDLASIANSRTWATPGWASGSRGIWRPYRSGCEMSRLLWGLVTGHGGIRHD